MQSETIIHSLNKSLTSESDDNNLNEFVERIQTYIDDQKWIRKPITLSPAICSQYGWKCIKSDLLECITCSAKLSVHEPKIENFAAYKACILKIVSDLKDNHGKHCPWPLTPSPENFVRMTLMPKEEALQQFMRRLKVCLPFQSSFPKIKESTSNNLAFSENHISTLCKIAGISNEDIINFGQSLVSLAATGWIITEGLETSKLVFKCNSCLRSVWCGSFSLLKSSSKENGATAECASENDIPTNANSDEENLSEPPHKRKRISFVIKKGDPFDPLHEHRPWCLWIYDGIDDYDSISVNDKSTNAVKKAFNTPGWKIFVKSLLRNISDNDSLEVNNSPSKEQIRNVKSLLEKWTDVF